jgi:hypothetical protein
MFSLKVLNQARIHSLDELCSLIPWWYQEYLMDKQKPNSWWIVSIYGLVFMCLVAEVAASLVNDGAENIRDDLIRSL